MRFVSWNLGISSTHSGHTRYIVSLKKGYFLKGVKPCVENTNQLICVIRVYLTSWQANLRINIYCPIETYLINIPHNLDVQQICTDDCLLHVCAMK